MQTPNRENSSPHDTTRPGIEDCGKIYKAGCDRVQAAVSSRAPPLGCIRHSDRGSQYAAADYRAELAKHGLKGSMGRRGNPYDNAKAESFMKTLKVEEVYLMEYDRSGAATAAGLSETPVTSSADPRKRPSFGRHGSGLAQARLRRRLGGAPPRSTQSQLCLGLIDPGGTSSAVVTAPAADTAAAANSPNW